MVEGDTVLPQASLAVGRVAEVGVLQSANGHQLARDLE